MFENKDNRTELSQLGEFGLIKHIADSVEIKHKSTLKGIGDDAAVIDTEGKVTLVSTDMLVEGIHFDLGYFPLKHLGYKAVVSNLSDIYAMNGLPRQITVSIAVSNRFSLEAMEELYAGINLACDYYEVDLVGGDTSAATAGMVISVTVLGIAEKENVVYRNTAGENDLICVTGDLGASFTGLQLLLREKEIQKDHPGAQPELEGYDYILERHLKPEARWDMLERLSEAGIKPTSMIDVSDGLASELLHITEQSGVGCSIYEEKIPVDHQTIDAAMELGLNPVTCALNGGEDYELLFTVKLSDFEKIKTIKGISVIGHITEKAQGRYLVASGGNTVELKAQGWDAFLKK